MAGHQVIRAAATTATQIVGAIKPDQLDGPTPCHEFTVRRLLAHLRYWGPSLLGAASRTELPPPAAGEPELHLITHDWSSAEWATTLDGQFGELAAGWSDPAAWAGATRMGGPSELPAALVGGMVCTELVVHGWDLARATGQDPRWDGDLLEFVLAEVTGTAEQGRAAEVYAPAVPVPATAPTLDRLLALTGRDPSWRPQPGT